DFDLKKNDKENCSNGRKIDIVWATKPLKIEFAIAEISGPPNEHQHSHYFSDKIKIAKMLKIMLNRIVRVYGGAKTNLNLLKLYGLQ
ncbi:1553_t:CDS:1, partial [Dentiscutata erythropus]